MDSHLFLVLSAPSTKPVQGTGDLQQDYAASIVNATASQIDVLAPARGEQGAFDIYASALDGSTPVNSNPLSFTYGPQVTTYNLDGAGNREDVVTATGTEDYTQDNTDPDPDDAAMNQYTQTPLDVADRVYDGNGNLLHTGAAFPTRYRHDYLDRITQAVGMPAIGSGTVPAGSEFTDDFTGGKDAAWEFNPAVTGGIMSTQWNATNDTLVSSGSAGVASAVPRTDPDGDFWWVYTRPSGASGNNIMAAYLRALGQEDDVIGSPPTLAALYLDIQTSGVSLVQSFGGFTASSGAITTDEDTPYLMHVHVIGSTVVVRRGEVGGTMETILETDSAPLQDTDRFILESASPCIVDDVNIGHFKVEYTYDALGRRIERRVDNGGDRSKTRFLYDGVHVAEEWDIPESGSPTLDASYVYGLYVDDVLTMRRGGEDYYYHADDLGNVMKLTDADGQVVEGYDYGDYGAPEFYDENGAPVSATASVVGNPYLFNGRRWDPELGYYYYRNRRGRPLHCWCRFRIYRGERIRTLDLSPPQIWNLY